MITNVEELKAELIARHIAYEDEMCGCSEQEILEIEAKYGKLPLSYRQIIGLIGHSAGFLAADTEFYVSLDKNIDQIIWINEDYLEFKKETIENNEVEEHIDLLKLPKNMFIINSWSGNESFILTDRHKHKKDSLVYQYSDSGTLGKGYSQSVWKFINRIITTSFDGDRSNVNPFWLSHYRKPEYKGSGEIIIHEGHKNPDIVKQFINSEESRQWYEETKNI